MTLVLKSTKLRTTTPKEPAFCFNSMCVPTIECACATFAAPVDEPPVSGGTQIPRFPARAGAFSPLAGRQLGLLDVPPARRPRAYPYPSFSLLSSRAARLLEWPCRYGSSCGVDDSSFPRAAGHPLARAVTGDHTAARRLARALTRPRVFGSRALLVNPTGHLALCRTNDRSRAARCPRAI